MGSKCHFALSIPKKIIKKVKNNKKRDSHKGTEEAETTFYFNLYFNKLYTN